MKQLYAVMTKGNYSLFQYRFPDAVDVGEFKMGVFVDTELSSILAIGDVEIMTYEQAKEFVKSNIQTEGEI